MKVLVDMNMSPNWVDVLIASGHEAIHWSTCGDVAADDSLVMEYARAGDYVLLTHDLDFGELLAASGATKPSVVQLRIGNLRPELFHVSVAAVLTQYAGDLNAGALITIHPERARVTVLPLADES